MQFLFNTIMLEINRWTEHHTITKHLIDLLPNLYKANFKKLEIWQYHLSSISLNRIKQLKDKMDSFNITAPVVGVYTILHADGQEAKKMDSLINHMVDAATILNANIIKILPGNIASSKLDIQTRKLSVERIKKIAYKIAEKGMQLSLETHPNTLCDTKHSTLTLMYELKDCKNIGICYQPYDEETTNEAIKTFTEMLPFIIHIHLQNLPYANAETTTFLEKGKWIDYTRLLPHIKNSGYDKIFSLEFTEGIFPPEGEIFDPQTVIDNAVIDREFFCKFFN